MKKNIFYISLIIIYLLFLAKDYFFKLFDNFTPDYYCERENFYQKEYENISKLLDIPSDNYEIIYSKVIFRNIYEFYNKVTIAKGENEITVGSAVVNNEGLIGIIDKSYKNYSEVQLLTNDNINLSVKINNSYGILTSKNNKIIIRNIKLESVIKEGDKVYTSGLTNITKDILIGTVSNITKDDLELEYIIEVTPAANFHNLNYVGVIK